MFEVLDDTVDFAAYIRETDAPTKVLPATAFLVDLKKRLHSRPTDKRYFLPWDKTTDNFDFRKGEVSIWAGQNGHGKSLITAQVALSLMGQGLRVCMASFELKPLSQMQRLSRMFSGENPYTPEYQNADGYKAIEQLYDDFGHFCTDKLWLYNHQGSIKHDLVVGMVRYCAKEKKIDHIFVDNLAKCIKAEDDYNGQKAFIDEMMVIAKDYDCHIHIVHHLKKPPKETDRPDKSDVKGSGAIVDQPDNLFLVWRNKAKEDDAKFGTGTKQTEPDALLLCKKQRNYEGSSDGEPVVALWFHKDSAQYLGAEGAEPMFFYNYPHTHTRWT